MDAAVDAVANEEGLVRAVSIALGELAASEQELEGMLRMYVDACLRAAVAPGSAGRVSHVLPITWCVQVREQRHAEGQRACEGGRGGGD